MATRRSAVGVALSAALLTALAACGGGSSAADPSSPLPITTTPTRSTATASATASIDPNSNAAIIAGVHAWADALTAASQKPNMTPLINAATKVCACITDTARSINYLESNHLHLNVGYKVVSGVITARTNVAATVHVVVSYGPYQALNADGSIFKQEPAGSQVNDFSLKLVREKWRVDTIF